MAPRETENNAYAKFGVTNKEHYGMLWYFLEWSIGIIRWNNSFTGNKDVLINRLTEWLRNSRQNPSPSVTLDPTQPVCVDLDGTLCDTSSPTLNNETGVSSKHILNVIQELKVKIEGIKRCIPPSHYEDKDKELINK